MEGAAKLHGHQGVRLTETRSMGWFLAPPYAVVATGEAGQEAGPVSASLAGVDPSVVVVVLPMDCGQPTRLGAQPSPGRLQMEGQAAQEVHAQYQVQETFDGCLETSPACTDQSMVA